MQVMEFWLKLLGEMVPFFLCLYVLMVVKSQEKKGCELLVFFMLVVDLLWPEVVL